MCRTRCGQLVKKEMKRWRHSHDCDTASDRSLTSEVLSVAELVSVKRTKNDERFSWDSVEVGADDEPNDSRRFLSAVS
jgi:hypothetical protein